MLGIPQFFVIEDTSVCKPHVVKFVIDLAFSFGKSYIPSRV